ncbi:MAG TPA: hypothetical protein EYP49_19680 [Anaerolineae bacterium]|nr:hypothetical protein [Anaerolineae bacterium]
MDENKRRLTFGLSLLVAFTIVACTAGGSASLPGGPVEVSTEAAQRVEAKLVEALTLNPNDQFILRFTDEEVTSFIALKLEESVEPPITDPQIRFTKGKIYVAGKLTNIGPIQVRAMIVAVPRITDDQLVINVESVYLGPVPIPNTLLDSFSQTIDKALAEAQVNLRITQVEIFESEIVIVGEKRL